MLSVTLSATLNKASLSLPLSLPLSINSDVDKTHRCLVRIKIPNLSLSTYKSRYKKDKIETGTQRYICNLIQEQKKYNS